ncbi:MAG TPA: hypothetical protein VHU43_09010 [Steroidobacteraceae bacterium]|nr:hypothetical protein [Steroidobacteraceae bacterium]
MHEPKNISLAAAAAALVNEDMDAAARYSPGFGPQVIKRLVASGLHGDGELLFLKDGVL